MQTYFITNYLEGICGNNCGNFILWCGWWCTTRAWWCTTRASAWSLPWDCPNIAHQKSMHVCIVRVLYFMFNISAYYSHELFCESPQMKNALTGKERRAPGKYMRAKQSFWCMTDMRGTVRLIVEMFCGVNGTWRFVVCFYTSRTYGNWLFFRVFF